MDFSDDELMALHVGGDTQAFERLFERHHASVYHFAATMLADASAAEEVLQESFLAAARASGQYRGEGRFRAWLMRIVRNRCLNLIDARRRHRAVGELPELPAAGSGPAGRAEADEGVAILRAAVAALPERQREALTLRAFEQMSYREIASVMDMPIGTIKTLIHRARAALAQSPAAAVKGDES